MRRLRPAAFGLAFGFLGTLFGCRDDLESPAGPGDPPALTPASAAAALSFRQLSVGDAFVCGVTTDERVWCWGSVVDGTPGDHSRPVAVAGGIAFQQVSAGTAHVCGVTPANLAYCWGRNEEGELGDGTTTFRPVPTPVGGGHRFTQVSAGGTHSCGVSTPDRVVYCWGWNASGQLGDFSTTTRLTPVAVADGRRRFRQVSAGSDHTCAITPKNEAWCWGRAKDGQIGDGHTVARRTAPKLVTGGHPFTQIESGVFATCGVTTDRKAYCWGNGSLGQLGDGKTSFVRNTPAVVAGGHVFDRVAIAESHACAEDSSNRAWCWGDNSAGRLGDGSTTITRLKPVAVAGGLRFVQVTVGIFNTCGVTDTGAGYCWGFNNAGQIGDGTTTDRSVPTPVAGPI